MTVLNIIELTKTHPIINSIFIVSLILGFLSFTCIIALPPFKYENFGGVCAAILFISIISVIVCDALSDVNVVPNGKVKYEVIIDDSITFSEFSEKYNVVEQRGEIFVVEEKDE